MRRRGHRFVAAVGASMGGTAVLRAAGLGPPARFDAVCAISAPAAWELAARAAGRRLSPLLRSGAYRTVVGAVAGVRVAPSAWTLESDASGARRWVGPVPSLELVGRVAPTPLLLVHGTDDHLFPVAHALALARAADEPSTLWLEPAGFGHAEDGFRRAFVDRLAAAVVAVVADGRWPPRSAAASVAATGRAGEAGHPT